jgi:predicted ester cyclase
MCVDPRTLVRTAAVLACSFVVVVAAGCGGSQPRQETPEAPLAPATPTAAERAAWYQDCWTQFNNKAWDAFRACYAESAESEQVDSGQPAAMGADAVVAAHKAFTEAFPDVKGTGNLILVSGDAILSIYTLNGTHSGPLAGPNGQSIPATGKPIGFLQAHLLQTDSSGKRVAKEQFYSDSGTMLAQLGLNPNPARPVATAAAAAPTVVIAEGTPAELSNVDAARAQLAAFNSHDAKGIVAFNAPDVILREAASPKDTTVSESLAGALDMFAAFPDAKLVTSSVWGAGDYVVVAGRFEGTNTGPFAAMGVRKATGKPVAVRFVEITKWQNGKVKEDWLFYDGMSFAGQLGLLKK